MMHPDLQKALELVTRHAGRAHAERVFAHLLNVPTPGKALDEQTKNEVLNQDMVTGQPVEHMEPDGDEDQYGHEPMGEEESLPMGPADEHPEGDPPKHFGMATTIESTIGKLKGPAPVPKMMEASELPRKKRGRPAKVK